MKKILSLVLAAAMVMSLAACGDKGKTSQSGDDSGSGQGTTAKDTLIIGHYGDTPNFDTHKYNMVNLLDKYIFLVTLSLLL